MWKGVVRLVLIWFALGFATAEDAQCPIRKECMCEFSNDADGGEDMAATASSKSEILAAAAGAMSPLLVGGAALGIYKLVKKSSDSPGLDRQDSNVSDAPAYSSRKGSPAVPRQH
ncbi:uncharacterized protein LOC127872921 [Dreissena polymorpha]|uniref:Uncharacterized protein n=1 Tax=Dreissena polymorpha TaxID=45954 RepID=A0A9D4R5E2_DREPO|nr:uncharacterized protein LOC127872921 [Dreissena polymorpha]KAH3854552.1 hypothetical protein DPMN_097095 [Dreissena polymorpha]